MFLDRIEAASSASSEPAAASPSEAGQDVAALFHRYKANLLRFCQKHLRNRDDANDLVQDVFYAVTRRADGEFIRRPQAYLFQTAMNLIRDRRDAERCRRIQAHVGLDQVDEVDLVSAAPSAELVVEARQDIESVFQALEELPLEIRSVFVLKRCLGYSYKEIAAELGIPVHRVNMHIVAAVAHLRDRLDIWPDSVPDSALQGVNRTSCAAE